MDLADTGYKALTSACVKTVLSLPLHLPQKRSDIFWIMAFKPALPPLA